METGHFIGVFLVAASLILLGVYSGRRIGGVGDYLKGSRTAGIGLTCGGIIGSSVGSVATIGTAELAYQYGWSAIWFSIGMAMGIGVFSLWGRSIRRDNHGSIVALVKSRYQGYGGHLIFFAGVVLQLAPIITQMVAGRTMWVTMLPQLTDLQALLITGGLIFIYIGFGGIRGVGILGIMKAGLMLLGILICITLTVRNEPMLVRSILSNADSHSGWFSQGGLNDISPAVNTGLGMLVGQSLYTTILAAKNERVIATATGISIAFVLLFGTISTVIGMYMAKVAPGLPASGIFIQFLLLNLSPIVAGIIMGSLLLATMGVAASACLALVNYFVLDIYYVYLRPNASRERALLLSRLCVIIVLAVSIVTCILVRSMSLVNVNSLSTGSRAVVLLIPFVLALYGRSPLSDRRILIAIAVGMVTATVVYCFGGEVSGLYSAIGIVTEGIVLLLFPKWCKKNSDQPFTQSAIYKKKDANFERIV